MPSDLFQSAVWPGVLGVASCTYVCSHGITPGRAVLVTWPQVSAPAAFGDLTFSDGRRYATVPNCKVERITPQQSAAGTTYTLEIVDGRWQWPGLGGVTGHYNQKDERGKLVPWTIKSPRELALICVKALGITDGTFELPDGLTGANNKNLNRYLARGENFPQSLTNPEVAWTRTPPAEALAQLADTYGLRVVYQPLTRRISLLRPGGGRPFPTGPLASIGATVESPKAPAYVGVFGAPVKIQARFLLQAVGREWDDTYVPINQLSYAPAGKAQVQISRVGYLEPSGSDPVEVALAFTDPQTGEEVVARGQSTAPGLSVADRWAQVRAQLLANAAVARNLTLVVNGVLLTATGKSPFAFTLTAANLSGTGRYAVETVQQANDPRLNSWAYSGPPAFQNVQATDRLSFAEAQGLARQSVFRCYRILPRDPHDLSDFSKPGRPLELPWFGRVKRRQQIVLQDSKVEQVVPRPRIPGAVNKGVKGGALEAPGQGVLPEFYNGYSRDQGNTVTGSVAYRIGTANWLWALNREGGLKPEDAVAGRCNTAADDRVFVGFAVNAVEQMIVFDEPVYFWNQGAQGFPGVSEPLLTLEAGCFVKHPETDAVVRWEEVLRVPGGIAPTEWAHREDVFVGVVGRYGPANAPLGFDFAELADARSRAGYYLRGQAAKYKVTGGETRQYHGIVVHEPDGYCQQVTWSVGEDGPRTTLSGNTEHQSVIPPYPARRRVENLPADKAAAAVNLTERALMLAGVPKEAR